MIVVKIRKSHMKYIAAMTISHTFQTKTNLSVNQPLQPHRLGLKALMNRQNITKNYLLHPNCRHQKKVASEDTDLYSHLIQMPTF